MFKKIILLLFKILIIVPILGIIGLLTFDVYGYAADKSSSTLWAFYTLNAAIFAIGIWILVNRKSWIKYAIFMVSLLLFVGAYQYMPDIKCANLNQRCIEGGTCVPDNTLTAEQKMLELFENSGCPYPVLKGG